MRSSSECDRVDETPVACTAVQLVVTDLDGTLWELRSGRAHRRSVHAINAVLEMGIPVLVATGRSLSAARELLAANGLALPIVALDGTIGQSFDGTVTFHDGRFAGQDASAVLEVLHADRLDPLLHVDEAPVESVVETGSEFWRVHSAYFGASLRHADLRETLRASAVYEFVAYGDRDVLEHARTRIDSYGAGVLISDGLFGGPALTVHAHHANKWIGARRYCEWRGLDPGRVLAVGNGENDLDLLSGAAIACVMGDGCAQALELADHVLEPAGRGGWSQVHEVVASLCG
jgi:HAD superfamily hydrolase (TIGR01484 family)